MAAEFNGIWLVNIYAPSGAARRQEREHFYNSELTYLLRAAPEHMTLGEDFNGVLDKRDTTGNYNNSRALAELIHGFALRDAWTVDPAISA